MYKKCGGKVDAWFHIYKRDNPRKAIDKRPNPRNTIDKCEFQEMPLYKRLCPKNIIAVRVQSILCH